MKVTARAPRRGNKRQIYINAVLDCGYTQCFEFLVSCTPIKMLAFMAGELINRRGYDGPRPQAGKYSIKGLGR